MIVAIYCSGSIIKGDNDTTKQCWGKSEREQVSAGAKPMELCFLNPDDPVIDLSDVAALFGRDMFQIQSADFVIIDCRERRGIGVGVELLASRLFETPVIAVAPKNSCYRSDHIRYRGGAVDDYIHPHLAVLADAIVGDFVAAGTWIGAFLDASAAPRSKSVDSLHDAISIYEERLLPSDRPMQELVAMRRRSPGVMRPDGPRLG